MATTQSHTPGLFDDTALTDVTIKFGPHEKPAHKAILAQKSVYFHRAFTGAFPVAHSGEVDLGDEDDAEAVHAMIRHIYDIPYYQKVWDTIPGSTSVTNRKDLAFHIDVFTVADKYDVPCLRSKVVTTFKDLLKTEWESEYFISIIQRLCGPSAGHLADNSLQAATATFCANKLEQLVGKHDFLKLVEKEEPFTGHVLAALVAGIQGRETVLMTCFQTKCLAKKDVKPRVCISSTACVHCGISSTASYTDTTGKNRSGLKVFKRVNVLLMNT